MILLPIGRDESEIQRHAWISYAIIAANVLMFIGELAIIGVNREQTRTTVSAAIMYIIRHPYLTIPQALSDIIPDDVEQKLKSGPAQIPSRYVIREEQDQLETLAAAAVSAYRKLPTVRWGYIPAENRLSSIVTSIFVHGSVLHLLGNMLFFFLSGPFVEDVFGRPLFAGLYFAGGFVATLTYWAQHPTSMIPLVGASGAIAAVMGAYLVRFAKSKIQFIFIPFWFRPTVNFRFFLPAFVVLPMWFLQQFIEMKSEAGSGTAFSAHVGGFIFGAALALIVNLTGFEEKHVAPKIKRDISWEIDPRIANAMAARDKFDFETAKRQILAVLREKPNDIDALRTAVDIGRAAEDAAMIDSYGTRLLTRLIESKEDDAAIELVQEITVQIDAVSIPRFTARAATFVERRGDRDWAMILYEKALKGDPFGMSAVPSLVKLGGLKKAKGDVTGARSALQEARAHPACSAEWATSIDAKLNELSS